MNEKVKSATKTTLKGGKALVGFAKYLEESRVRRDTAISIRKDLTKGKKEYVKNGNDFYIIEALNKAWTFTGNPNIAPEVPLNSEKINKASKIIAVIIEPSLFKESLESAEKKIDELVSKLEAPPPSTAGPAEEKAEPTKINETAENLQKLLENPEKYGLKGDQQGLEDLVNAAWTITQDPALDPATKEALQTRVDRAKEVLKKISESPETIVNLNQNQLTTKSAIEELAILTQELKKEEEEKAERIEGVPAAPAEIEGVPPRAIGTGLPAQPGALATGLGVAAGASSFVLRKIGGTVYGAASTFKRASSGSIKDIALSGFLLGGLLIGGPFGAGLVLFALSPKFRKFLLAAIFVSLTNIITIMFVSLAVITFSIAIILFIINAGAYVVPPGAPIIGAGPSGGVGGIYPTCWPTYGTITQGPGPQHATWQNSGQAIDIAYLNRSPVYATHDGTATYYWDPADPIGYGWYVMVVSTTGSFTTIYGHLEGQLFQGSRSVKAGDLIGYMDNTGSSSGTHLHYEVIGLLINNIVPPYTVGDITKGCFASESGGGSLPPSASGESCSSVGVCNSQCSPSDIISEPSEGWSDCSTTCCKVTPVQTCESSGNYCSTACRPDCIRPFIGCTPGSPICCDPTCMASSPETPASCTGTCLPSNDPSCIPLQLPEGASQWDCPPNAPECCSSALPAG
jgi:hypothetical protein